APRLAFGVDPRRPEYYSLRAARYDAAATDIDAWAREAGRTLEVLDIGCAGGPLVRPLQARPNTEVVRLSAADLKIDETYKKEAYAQLFVGDLMQGYPQIPSDAYDVVVCEQVLEHLTDLPLAMATLERVLKPGGRLIVGVPIFPPPLHSLRR